MRIILIDYYYCGSTQIFLKALSQGKDKVVVLISSPDFIKTCDQLGYNFFKIKQFNIKNYLFRSKEVKKEISKIVDLINDNPIHFSHTQFSVFSFLLLKACQDRYGNAIFHNFEYEYSKADRLISLNKSFLKTWLSLKALNHNFSTRIVMKEISGIYLPGIDGQFLKKLNAKIVNDKASYYQDVTDGLSSIQIPLKKNDTIFLTQNLMKIESIIDNDSLIYLYEQLRKAKSFGIKFHPNTNEKERKFFSDTYHYPRYLPVEIIFGNLNKAVISVHSAALISASYFKNIKAVSVMNLLEWKDPEFKNNIENDLINKSNNQIIFVKNYKELRTYL